MADTELPLLDDELADFVGGAVSITLASCHDLRVPHLARGTGCRVAADRRQLTVLLATSAGADVLADVRTSGRVAVVFSLPQTHRTLQLKGNDARVVSLDPGDLALAVSYVDAFANGLQALGYSGAVIRSVLRADAADLVGIRFTPASGSLQTPGPEAGQALRS
jgi:hypothetical protein